jgi:hypothetical protein
MKPQGILSPFVNILSSESVFAAHGSNITPLETTPNSLFLKNVDTNMVNLQTCERKYFP